MLCLLWRILASQNRISVTRNSCLLFCIEDIYLLLPPFSSSMYFDFSTHSVFLLQGGQWTSLGSCRPPAHVLKLDWLRVLSRHLFFELGLGGVQRLRLILGVNCDMACLVTR